MIKRFVALVPKWIKNALWKKARAVPSLDLPFAESKSLVDATTGTNLVTFTRASSGTYVGSDGLIKTATTNEPRFDHDPTTGESLGLLVEESRTNSLVYSEKFDNGAWFRLGTAAFGSGSITNAAIAPDGTLTADKIATESGRIMSRILQRQSGTGVYTFSVYAKAAEADCIFVAIYTGSTYKHLYYDLSNENIVSVTASAYSAVNVGNGWFRLSVTETTSDLFGNISFGLSNSVLGNEGVFYTGDGTSGIYLWGAQLEAGSFPTSYIPAEGSRVTRAADVATDTTRGAALRSLFAQFRSPASGTRPIVSLDDGTANERIELFTSGTDPKLLVTDGGSTQADLDAGSITANTTARLAARFNTDNFAASVSGGAEVADTTGTMPTVNRVSIGRDQAGNCLNGHIARITGWDSPLPLLPTITQ